MKTKAEVRTDAAVTVVASTRKARTPKEAVVDMDAVLNTPIGGEVDHNAFTAKELAAAGLKAHTPSTKAAAQLKADFVGPLPQVAPTAKAPASDALYAMPAGVATRPGTRKAAVYDAMLAVSPATRAQLIAAAEAAEQAWRSDTKRLEAAKPGAKWFRRFAPLAEGIIG